jgi:hypothetical protein
MTDNNEPQITNWIPAAHNHLGTPVEEVVVEEVLVEEITEEEISE